MCLFCQAEDGIRDLVRSRGLGDVYKRQVVDRLTPDGQLPAGGGGADLDGLLGNVLGGLLKRCLLYTSDAADERSSVDLGGRRIIKKKRLQHTDCRDFMSTVYLNSIKHVNDHRVIQKKKDDKTRA